MLTDPRIRDLEGMMRCIHCNTPMPEGQRLCPACGGRQEARSGANLYQRLSHEVEADHSRWRREWTVPEAVLTPEWGEALAPSVVEPVSALDAKVDGRLNLLLLHAGFSPFRSLRVAVDSEAGAASLDYRSRPGAIQGREIPIAPRSGTVEPPALAPDLDIFEDLDEAVQGTLEVTLRVEGQEMARKGYQVTVQPSNEWVDQPGAAASLAGAVTPNSTPVVGLAASLEGNFMAYQAPESRRREELAAVYNALGKLGLHYVNVPPSFEGTGQKVLFPDQVLQRRQGCCLDIALLEASLLERLGYRPLILFLRDQQRGGGHALCGVWTQDVLAHETVLFDRAILDPMVESGDLELWNSTSRFEGEADFEAARAAGRTWMQHFAYALDLGACRRAGIKPLSRRRS